MTPITRRAILELGLAGLAGFFLEACAGDAATGSTTCVAGESVDCALETCLGKATCQPDGSFSQCICDGGTTGTGSVTATSAGTTGAATTGSGTTSAVTTGTGTTGTGTTGMGAAGTGTTGMTGTTATGTTGMGVAGAGGATSTTSTSGGGAAGMGTTGAGGGMTASGTGMGGAGGMGAGGGPGMGGTAAAGMCSAGINVSDGNGITSFHVHALMIPGVDIQAGAPMTYTMTGDHTHTVSLTAAEFEQLRNGQTVNVTSSNDDDHTHAVALSC